MYLLGEPVFKPAPRDKFLAPAGQANLCLRVFEESTDPDVVRQKLAEEYVAIAASLKTMGVDFRILFVHREDVEMPVIEVCVGHLGCRLGTLDPSFAHPMTMFPRDMSTNIPGVLLVSENFRVSGSERNGWKIHVSPWGEGGRILSVPGYAVVSERISTGEKSSYAVDDQHTLILREAGLSVMTMPPPLVARMNMRGEMVGALFNDHVDRVGCLVQDPKGRPHLIVEPLIGGTRRSSSRNDGEEWEVIGADEMIALLKRSSRHGGIEFHLAPRLRVPYALNLFQHVDGRILMTGGESEVVSLLEEVAGRGSITETPVPIRYFPAWLQAGIRCLINEAPTPFLKKSAT
jgi:hypothetical protein